MHLGAEQDVSPAIFKDPDFGHFTNGISFYFI
jgi:hypothetical protein